MRSVKPNTTDARSESVLSDEVEWQLLVTVQNQTTELMLGGVALAGGAVFGWLQTRELWFLIWACAALLALAGRLLIDHRFRQCRAQVHDFRVWRRRYITGAWAMSALWGVAAYAIALPIEETLRLVFIVSLAVLVVGSASRSAGCPTGVHGQIVLGLGPLCIAFVLKGDRDHLILSVFVLLLIAATLIMLRNSHRQTVRMLCAIEDNAELVKTVQQGNSNLMNVNSELAAANLKLEGIATTDALTGVGNRRRFDDMLSTEVLRVRSDSNELSVLMLDVDTFKGFNDSFGHQAGDVCLRQIAAALSASLRRPADVIARYGGEEFAAILPQTNAAAALALAERMRANVEALAIPSVTGPVTVSVGVATFGAQEHSRSEDYIRAADGALYVAKGAGRNCVRVAVSGHQVKAVSIPMHGTHG